MESMYFQNNRQQMHCREAALTAKLAAITDEQEVVSTERTTAQFERLNQEADKICKWKIQTEYELRDKTKRLDEANQSLSSQRKVLQELQFKNEQLEHKYKAEVEKQKGLDERINATRQMCTSLKTFANYMEKKATESSAEMKVVKEFEQQQVSLMEDLTTKFKGLELAISEKTKNFFAKVKDLNERNTQLQQEFQDEKAKAELSISELKSETAKQRREIEGYSTQISGLLTDAENKASVISALQTDKGSLANDLNGARAELEDCHSVIANREGEIVALKLDLEKRTDELETRTNEHDIVMANLKLLTAELAAFRDQAEHDQAQLKGEIVALKESLVECDKKIEELTSDNDAKLHEIDLLKSERDLLQRDFEEAQNEIVERKISIAALEKQLNDLGERGEDDARKAAERLSELTVQHELDLREVQLDRDELETQLECTVNDKAAALQRIETLEFAAAQDGNEILELNSKLAELQRLLTESREQSTTEVESMTMQLESVQKKEADALVEVKQLADQCQRALAEKSALELQVEAANKKWNEQVKQMENEKEADVLKISELQTSNERLESVLSEHMKEFQLESTLKSLNEAKNRGIEAAFRVHELSDRVNALECEKSKLINEAKNAAEHAKKVDDEMEAHEVDRVWLRDELNKVEKESKEKVSALQDKLKTMKQEAADMRKEIRQKEKEIKTKTTAVEKLEAEVSSLKLAAASDDNTAHEQSISFSPGSVDSAVEGGGGGGVVRATSGDSTPHSDTDTDPLCIGSPKRVPAVSASAKRQSTPRPTPNTPKARANRKGKTQQPTGTRRGKLLVLHEEPEEAPPTASATPAEKKRRCTQSSFNDSANSFEALMTPFRRETKRLKVFSPSEHALITPGKTRNIQNAKHTPKNLNSHRIVPESPRMIAETPPNFHLPNWCKDLDASTLNARQLNMLTPGRAKINVEAMEEDCDLFAGLGI